MRNPQTIQIRARVRVGINTCATVWLNRAATEYAGKMIIMPYSYDGHFRYFVCAHYTFVADVASIRKTHLDYSL